VRFFSKRRETIPLVVVCAAAVILVSCAGGVDRPEEVIGRMVRAHGGTEKIQLLGSYTAKGYLKDQYSTLVARHWPYDVYQRGLMFKSALIILEKGIVKDARYTVCDSQMTTRLSQKFDRQFPNPWELSLFEYRFPLVLQWVQRDTLEAKLADDGSVDGICKLDFIDGDKSIRLGVEKDTWLLHDVTIESRADTAMVFSEQYADYWKIDGVPFPARWTTNLNGRILFETFFSAVEFGIDLPDSVFTISEKERMAIPKEE
jgi:hypothetical protein